MFKATQAVTDPRFKPRHVELKPLLLTPGYVACKRQRATERFEMKEVKARWTSWEPRAGEQAEETGDRLRLVL